MVSLSWERAMKKFFACLGVAIYIFPSTAFGGETYFYGSPHLTLHFDVHLGTNNRALTAPAIGLSLDRELTRPQYFPYDRFGSAASTPFVESLIDLHFTPFGAPALHPELRVGGANVMTYSADNSIWRNPWLWVGIGAGALLISCAADNFPCGGSSNMSHGPSY
jgi:hypothetical protein